MESTVTQRLREMILDGTLPAGARVAEATIAERLGVSRTPVRNALPALATEGLLEPAGKRGYAVREFSVEDSFRGTELRCVLEGYAAREIASRGASLELMDLFRECLAEGDRIFAKGYLVREDELAYARMNKAFHDTIIRGAENELLAELVRRVYAIPLVAPSVVAFNKVPREQVFPILASGHHQHHAIVDAIDARQADVAEMLMRGHSSPARRSLGLDHADR